MSSSARWIVLILFMIATGYLHYKVKTIPDPAWTNQMQSQIRSVQGNSPLIGTHFRPFALTDVLTDSPFSSDSLRGKIVLLDFMTSWCGPCRMEMPALRQFASARPDVIVVGIDVLESTEKAEEFGRDMKINFPLLADNDGKASTDYDVHAYPTSVIIDESGVIRAVHAGACLDFEKLVDDALTNSLNPDTAAQEIYNRENN